VTPRPSPARGPAPRRHMFQLVNPTGETLSKDAYLGGIASGELDYLVFKPAAEIAVRFHGEAAVIRYRSNLQIAIGGQDLGLATFWHTDSYELRDGRWQAVWSQATGITAPPASATPTA